MRNICCVLLLTLIMTGCAGMQVKQGVHGNTFYSTYPELVIKMTREMEYIDKKHTRKFFSYTSGLNTPRDQKMFVFGDRLNREMIFIYMIKNEHGDWNSNTNYGIKNMLEEGFETHGKKRYQYGVFPYQDNKGDCFLAKRLARIVGGNTNVLLIISYVRFLKGSSSNCNEWKQVEDLTTKQKKFLAEFMEDSEKKMQFVDLADLKLEDS